MISFLAHWFPNVTTNYSDFTISIVQTIEMIIITGIISFILSIILGVILTVTKQKGILQNLVIWNTLDKLINLFRSIPFIILIVALIPLTNLISGTAIGVKGSLFPLIVGITPFFTRQIESALASVSPGLIETGQAIGLSPFEIIKAIYLRQSLPDIIRMTTTTLVNLVGLTAIVGVVGGGGIGNYAIQYGYQQNEFDVTIACIIVLLLMVSVIQLSGTFLSNKTTH
ncbi:methionine ABC transporter permease [Acetilactobacillus jinshanensis]|uniref:ABC transporter permease subunit n=1 Tax=Acetilactobacillus jinshanensis TaxID=1720083 RepID=A0A4P6ZKU9_9LACO|nr:ABC transporter permease subunit [Acetilactobacillus jinshanensis]QBP18431.1 ABC transporter permease subunit [Acetilactobacillus jinshanensis]URL61302.1 ABC transporter permease subunit [uncultured bacterium]